MMESKNSKAIKKILASFVRDNEATLNQAFELVYFFRGAISYEEIMNMSPSERELATTYINKRLEAASKMPMPIY